MHNALTNGLLLLVFSSVVRAKYVETIKEFGRLLGSLKKGNDDTTTLVHQATAKAKPNVVQPK